MVETRVPWETETTARGQSERSREGETEGELTVMVEALSPGVATGHLTAWRSEALLVNRLVPTLPEPPRCVPPPTTIAQSAPTRTPPTPPHHPTHRETHTPHTHACVRPASPLPLSFVAWPTVFLPSSPPIARSPRSAAASKQQKKVPWTELVDQLCAVAGPAVGGFVADGAQRLCPSGPPVDSNLSRAQSCAVQPCARSTARTSCRAR